MSEPSNVHHGGQVTNERALVEISPPMGKAGGQAFLPASPALFWGAPSPDRFGKSRSRESNGNANRTDIFGKVKVKYPAAVSLLRVLRTARSEALSTICASPRSSVPCRRTAEISSDARLSSRVSPTRRRQRSSSLPRSNCVTPPPFSGQQYPGVRAPSKRGTEGQSPFRLTK
ncbi:hypothetical protein SAMN04488527_12728 [Aliiroseovarius crassostreae]|nr:hypothetical protein SAMN04488527_12728 [Aliiroseovarius crassostreae]